MSPTTAAAPQSDVSALKGTASAARPAVTVNDIDFGNVKVGATTRTLTVTNTGNAPLDVTTIGQRPEDQRVHAP